MHLGVLCSRLHPSLKDCSMCHYIREALYLLILACTLCTALLTSSKSCSCCCWRLTEKWIHTTPPWPPWPPPVIQQQQHSLPPSLFRLQCRGLSHSVDDTRSVCAVGPLPLLLLRHRLGLREKADWPKSEGKPLVKSPGRAAVLSLKSGKDSSSID